MTPTLAGPKIAAVGRLSGAKLYHLRRVAGQEPRPFGYQAAAGVEQVASEIHALDTPDQGNIDRLLQ